MAASDGCQWWLLAVTIEGSLALVWYIELVLLQPWNVPIAKTA